MDCKWNYLKEFVLVVWLGMFYWMILSLETRIKNIEHTKVKELKADEDGRGNTTENKGS